MGRGARVRSQDILRRRGPFPGRCGTAGQMGAAGRAGLGGLEQPELWRKASYYSAVCLESGEVERMEVEGNSNSGTSVLFLRQLRERHAGPLHVIWDNAPAHRGEAVREYLGTPGLGLRLVNLPDYSPDFNADEAVWGWVREDATGNLSLGTCAWGPRLGCRRGSGTSSPRWPAGSRRSNAAAAPSCNQGLKSYCGTPSPIANPSQMHIPPWLWFSLPLPSGNGGRNKPGCAPPRR